MKRNTLVVLAVLYLAVAWYAKSVDTIGGPGAWGRALTWPLDYLRRFLGNIKPSRPPA